MSEQIPLFELSYEDDLDIDSYDFYIVAFSGGKDSMACFLYLLEQGIAASRIELWHHCIDGKGNAYPLMDWPVTEDYCHKVASAFGFPIYFSWKEGGFLGEMLRENELTKPCRFETPNGLGTAGGMTGKRNTRRRFPQQAKELRTRWCSAYLKIDVASKALAHQPRFEGKRTLFITGERADEGNGGRAHYKVFEPHPKDARNGIKKRHIDHYRPVHTWTEQQVWEIIGRHKVTPHPAYRLGWGRVSCMTCIFGSENQWASIRQIANDYFERIRAYEEEFGCTIHRKMSVEEQAQLGRPYESLDDYLVSQAMNKEFSGPVIMDDWALPAGAFGESNGSP